MRSKRTRTLPRVYGNVCLYNKINKYEKHSNNNELKIFKKTNE